LAEEVTAVGSIGNSQGINWIDFHSYYLEKCETWEIDAQKP
jgi:hypothetical protein